MRKEFLRLVIYRYFIVLPTTSPYGYSSSNWRRRIEIVSLIICFITFSVLTCPQLRCSATLSRYSATPMRYLEDADYKSTCANGIGAENGAGITNPLAQTVSGQRTVPGLQIRLCERYRGGERCRDYMPACANGIGAENGAGITYPLARTVSGWRTVPGLHIRLREQHQGRGTDGRPLMRILPLAGS